MSYRTYIDFISKARDYHSRIFICDYPPNNTKMTTDFLCKFLLSFLDLIIKEDVFFKEHDDRLYDLEVEKVGIYFCRAMSNRADGDDEDGYNQEWIEDWGDLIRSLNRLFIFVIDDYDYQQNYHLSYANYDQPIFWVDVMFKLGLSDKYISDMGSINVSEDFNKRLM